MFKQSIIYTSLVIFWLLSSCNKDPRQKIQGVYTVDKVALKKILSEKTSLESAFAANLLEKVIENAVIEFKVSNDSITGLMFLAGKTTLINSKIQLRNDSMLISLPNSESYLVPNAKGFTLVNTSTGASSSLEMIKSKEKDFSKETKDVIAASTIKEKEEREFKANLGKWQKGKYVDEFGDNTNQEFVYSIVPTSHENSYSSHSDLYTKIIITKNEKMYFEIFNESFSIKENFPENKFGAVKIKFPTDEIKSKKIFFGKNLILESPDNKNDKTIYAELIENEGPLKLYIDLATASDYYSDKYQFTLQRNNLIEMLNQLKEI